MKYLQFSSHKFKDQRIVAFIGNDPPTDPEATKQIVRPLVEQTEEYRQQQEFAAKKLELHKKQNELNSEYHQYYNPSAIIKWQGLPGRQKEIQIEYVQIQRELEDLEKEIVEHAKKCDEIWKQIRIDNAVCLAPRNAVLLDDDESKKWGDLINQKRLDQHLLENGEIISNEEIELERIAELTPEARQAEKEAQLSGALGMSMHLRQELEIKGDSDALTKAQEWYKLESEKIEKRYFG